MFCPTRIKTACIAAVMSLGLAASAMAEPNPEYTSWAKCKPGASVTIKGNTEAMGQKTSQTIVNKLVELTPEKAVIETTMSMEMMGQSHAMPGRKREIPAEMKMHKMPDAPKMDPAMMEKMKAAAKDAKKGEETITVAGKDFKCETVEMDTDSEQQGMKIHTKTWTNTEIPGGMVKMESTTSGSVVTKTTMEMIEFKDGN